MKFTITIEAETRTVRDQDKLCDAIFEILQHSVINFSMEIITTDGRRTEYDSEEGDDGKG